MTMINYKRQVFHLLLGILIFFLLKLTNKALLKYLLFFPIVFGLFSIYKIENGEFKLLKKIAKLFKKRHAKEGEGALFFFLGTFFTLSFFTKDISLISILVLTISDPLATVLGVNFGKKSIFEDKTLIGTISFFLSSLLILSFYRPLPVSILTAGLSAFFELFGNEILDDNLIIPLVVGASLSLF